MIKDELLALLYWSHSWQAPMGPQEVFEALKDMGVTEEKIIQYFKDKQ